jgi:hypothetical protein
MVLRCLVGRVPDIANPATLPNCFVATQRQGQGIPVRLGPFGRAPAPTISQPVQTMRGPNSEDLDLGADPLAEGDNIQAADDTPGQAPGATCRR